MTLVKIHKIVAYSYRSHIYGASIIRKILLKLCFLLVITSSQAKHEATF